MSGFVASIRTRTTKLTGGIAASDKIIEDYNNRIASSCGAVGPFAVRCVFALPLHQPALGVPTIASSQADIELFDSVILPQQFRCLRSYTIANMPDDTSAQTRWSANVSADLRIRGRGIPRNGSGTGGGDDPYRTDVTASHRRRGCRKRVGQHRRRCCGG